ncbi:exodeoxyribonuclease V subunit alpha [Necropsobacter massiliensis]|uniref:exodeoxyribonuclease V subunit alpha n=1 Tax=Necropsobacter massiliensis TaxID=1400001 RepID=UPI000595E7D9|nr:exodeoxyribonuclease V subunit alpha [Necropsobacter massiliensis]
MLAILSQLKQQALISAGDYYFAKLIADKQQPFAYPQEVQNLAILLAALCNFTYQQGHTCLLLDDSLHHNLFFLPYSERHFLDQIAQKINALPVSRWQSALAGHIAFSDRPMEKNAPLVFQYDALYFYRIWQDEYRVAQYLTSAVKNAGENPSSLEMTNIAHVLARYFPTEESSSAPNRQKIAVAIALHKPFCLISGGPGTGKTTTVSRVLLSLQELNQCRLRIKLAAPTGKAAARLSESIGQALRNLSQFVLFKPDPALQNAIPTQAETIHRLLGVRPFSEKTRYNRQNPLPVDILVVDEASMIDLALMAKLLQALTPQTKLILLGDKDQLASVEAGAVLGELGKFVGQGYSAALTQYLRHTVDERLAAAARGNPMRDCLCNLVVSRRFGSKPYIGQLAEAVNQRQAARSWGLFAEHCDVVTNAERQIELIDFDAHLEDRSAERNTPIYRKACINDVVQSAVQNYTEYLREIKQMTLAPKVLDDKKLADIFKLFNKVRYLTALRVGEFGSETLNQYIAEGLRRQGWLEFNQSRDWYVGKPIMITENDANVGLFNGDIGLYLVTQDKNGEVKGRFWFENGNSELPSRIPSHEPAFAMTVHKSQGSEFNHTFLILPPEPNPVLSKELVYTGITRAKEKITVFANRLSWEYAVGTETKRQSGLGHLLQDMLGEEA